MWNWLWDYTRSSVVADKPHKSSSYHLKLFSSQFYTYGCVVNLSHLKSQYATETVNWCPALGDGRTVLTQSRDLTNSRKSVGQSLIIRLREKLFGTPLGLTRCRGGVPQLSFNLLSRLTQFINTILYVFFSCVVHKILPTRLVCNVASIVFSSVTKLK